MKRNVIYKKMLLCGLFATVFLNLVYFFWCSTCAISLQLSENQLLGGNEIRMPAERVLSTAKEDEHPAACEDSFAETAESLAEIAEDALPKEETALHSEAYTNKIRVMEFLESIYQKQTLSGQHTSPDMAEVKAVCSVTGKKPALLEFDFMDCSPSRIERGASGIDLEPVISWWEEGGLVAFCWHWNAPSGLIDKRPDKQWYRGFYTETTTFDFAKGVNDTQSEEYELLIRDIDAIAEELKTLKEAGVPVLWRPLHEASGGWFWWGSKGPRAYLKLWKLMYERLTVYQQLDNLIWVWNGEDPYWYPGDDTTDIVGIDFYGPKHDYSPREEEFKKALSYTCGEKMVALTETGVIPDPDLMIKRGTMWLWYCAWSDELVLAGDHKSYSEKYTECGMLKKVYGHESVITKDELPPFR
ncbi:hypothetical protein SDC9_105869 [bioreactor metagenome]|uniref:GH26 domain-containing protein n=1 Tax=bioreactor metagenome TaxID=1076179 RepID=A0A645B3A0_9ZZZZ